MAKRKRDAILITGGAGFVGSNLADALLADGERVILADNFARMSTKANAAWLLARYGERVRIETVDIRDASRVQALVRESSQVYHLASQISVTTSLIDPSIDLQTNVVGTFNVLEAARVMLNPPPVLFASTSKVYGGLENVPVRRAGERYSYADGRMGISEASPLDFHSPYGCSKGAADQYVHDYARIYGLPTVVFRMSCIYGKRQNGTEDQGWVADIARSLLRDEPVTIYGDGGQVRDVLWVGDLVRAMRAAMTHIDRVAGEVFNVGGGPGNAVSVGESVERLREIAGSHSPVTYEDWRPGDQRVYVTDISKIERMLDWRPTVGWKTGFPRLVDWLNELELASQVSTATGSVPGSELSLLADLNTVPARAIAELLGSLDQLHRAYGGGGFTILESNLGSEVAAEVVLHDR
jgi:CDP-paratose 2-epimerase